MPDGGVTMEGGDWVRAAKVSDIVEGKAVVFSLGTEEIAIFKSGKDFYAIGNICPHRGASLSEGHLENAQVTCAWHAWTFDVKTGMSLDIPGAKVKTYKVKIENQEIFVKE